MSRNSVPADGCIGVTLERKIFDAWVQVKAVRHPQKNLNFPCPPYMQCHAWELCFFNPKVYISDGRPLFVLSDAQKEEVIAQADSHLKTAKGRGYRRQVTRAEVIQLLSGLPRDASGLVSFHDAQKLIMGYREKQIARFKVIFPEIAAGMAKKKKPRSALLPSGAAELDGRNALTTTASGRAGAGSSLGSSEMTSIARSCGADGARGGGVGRRAKFSADVAPAEMFIKDAGFTPAGLASHVRETPCEWLHEEHIASLSQKLLSSLNA